MPIQPRIRDAWSVFAEAALDLLFPAPSTCAACGGQLSREEKYVCARCRTQIVLLTGPTCAKCGRPLTAAGLCRDCRERQHYYRLARSAVVYGGAVRECIHCLKYHHGTYLAPFLGGLLASSLKRADCLPEDLLVVPVPLHRRRLRERGYNQSELLAKEVARIGGWPLNSRIVKRGRYTLPQAGLGPDSRQSNVAGAFVIADDHPLQGRAILLIDDIYTTGATVDEVSKVLLAAGAKEVYAATVAIAIGHH